MEKEILKELQKVIKNYCSVSTEQITSKCNLRKDLGIDSFDVVCIVFDIEKKFSLSFTENEVDQIKTVDDAIKLIIAKKENL